MRTLLILLVLVGTASGAVLYAPDGVVPGIATPFDGPSDSPSAEDGSGGDMDATDDTGTTDDTGATDDAKSTATATSSGGEPFEFRVGEIDDCGRTCRDVTAALENVGEQRAENVVVEIEISTGGDVIWADTVEVGTLDPGETFRTTERVEIGYGDALAVESNDGWIEIETVVRYDGGSQTFTDERQVA